MTKPASRSEATRLGKWGAYRLGQLAAPGVGGPGVGGPGIGGRGLGGHDSGEHWDGRRAAPRPFRPWFGRPSHRGPLIAWLLAPIAGTALIVLGAAAGLWFAPFVIGLATGLAALPGGWRLRVTVPVTLVMAVGGWGVVLWSQSRRGLPVGSTARTIAAVAGLPASSATGLGLTLAVAAVQALAGLWFGRALTPRPGRQLPE